jgi:quercetin dioxygenase-like cupin family protein
MRQEHRNDSDRRNDTMATPQDEKAAEKFTGGNALELVAYQAGAVVSREIVKKKTGTVTLFAFDKAQGLSEHTAPFDALVQVLDGVAEITIGGVPHRLGKDEMILMPANVPHALKAVERFKMMLVMIREATG